MRYFWEQPLAADDDVTYMLLLTSSRFLRLSGPQQSGW